MFQGLSTFRKEKKCEIRKRKEERKTARSRRYMIASEERMNVVVEGAGSTSRVG